MRTVKLPRSPPGLTAFKGELGLTSGHWTRSQDVEFYPTPAPSEHASSGDMLILTPAGEGGADLIIRVPGETQEAPVPAHTSRAALSPL